MRERHTQGREKGRERDRETERERETRERVTWLCRNLTSSGALSSLFSYKPYHPHGTMQSSLKKQSLKVESTQELIIHVVFDQSKNLSSLPFKIT
jgi:hypothetical protein